MIAGAGTSSMQYRSWLGPSGVGGSQGRCCAAVGPAATTRRRRARAPDVTAAVACPRVVASAEEGNAERELHEGRVRIAGVSRPADARGHVDARLVAGSALRGAVAPQ